MRNINIHLFNLGSYNVNIYMKRRITNRCGAISSVKQFQQEFLLDKESIAKKGEFFYGNRLSENSGEAC